MTYKEITAAWERNERLKRRFDHFFWFSMAAFWLSPAPYNWGFLFLQSIGLAGSFWTLSVMRKLIRALEAIVDKRQRP